MSSTGQRPAETEQQQHASESWIPGLRRQTLHLVFRTLRALSSQPEERVREIAQRFELRMVRMHPTPDAYLKDILWRLWEVKMKFERQREDAANRIRRRDNTEAAAADASIVEPGCVWACALRGTCVICHEENQCLRACVPCGCALLCAACSAQMIDQDRRTGVASKCPVHRTKIEGTIAVRVPESAEARLCGQEESGGGEPRSSGGKRRKRGEAKA